KLIMDLTKGEIHETDIYESNTYRKLVFDNHRISMDAEQFTFQQSTPGAGTRGERELNTNDMLIIVDSLKNRLKEYQKFLQEEVERQSYFKDTQQVMAKGEDSKGDVVYTRL